MYSRYSSCERSHPDDWVVEDGGLLYVKPLEPILKQTNFNCQKAIWVPVIRSSRVTQPFKLKPSNFTSVSLAQPDTMRKRGIGKQRARLLLSPGKVKIFIVLSNYYYYCCFKTGKTISKYNNPNEKFSGVDTSTLWNV